MGGELRLVAGGRRAEEGGGPTLEEDVAGAQLPPARPVGEGVADLVSVVAQDGAEADVCFLVGCLQEDEDFILQVYGVPGVFQAFLLFWGEVVYDAALGVDEVAVVVDEGGWRKPA